MKNTNFTTREILIASAINLFVRKGYHATSIREISDACGMSKASIYYYFPRKIDVLLAVVDEMNVDFEKSIFSVLDLDVQSREEKVVLFMKALHEFLSRRGDVIVIPLLNLELSEEAERLSMLFREHLDLWVSAFCKLLSPFCSEHDARNVAEDSVAYFQGMLLFHRFDGEMGFLDKACSRVLKHLIDRVA